MGIFDRIEEKAAEFAGRQSIKELRRIREVLEVYVDSYRQANGMAPAFTKPMPEPEPLPHGAERGVIPSGAFQMIYLIEELCREHHIPLTAETDLEKIALDRGWLSPEGELLQYPLSARGMEVGE